MENKSFIEINELFHDFLKEWTQSSDPNVFFDLSTDDRVDFGVLMFD